MKSRLAPILGVVAILCVAAFLGYRHWTQTPQYSLWQAKKAADAKDLGRFEKYVDIGSCVESYVDATMAEVAAQQAPTSPDGMERVGDQLAQGFIAMMKPAMVAVVEKEIRRFVEGGAATPGKPGEPNDLSVDEWKKVANDRKLEYGGIDYVKRTGNTALVGLKFNNGLEPDKSFTAELKMRWIDGYWQLTGWNNAYAVLKMFGIGTDDSRRAASPGISGPLVGGKVPEPSPTNALTSEEVSYLALADKASAELKNELRNLNVGAQAYKAGDSTKFRFAASSAKSKMSSVLKELESVAVPPRLANADSYLRRALKGAMEGFWHWEEFANNGGDTERQAAIDTLEPAAATMNQAMIECDKVRDAAK